MSKCDSPLSECCLARWAAVVAEKLKIECCVQRIDIVCLYRDTTAPAVQRWTSVLACVNSQVEEALVRENALVVCAGADSGRAQLRRLAPVPAG